MPVAVGFASSSGYSSGEARTCFPAAKGRASVPSASWLLGSCPVFLQQLQPALDSEQPFLSCSRDALWIVSISSLFTEPQTSLWALGSLKAFSEIQVRLGNATPDASGTKQ